MDDRTKKLAALAFAAVASALEFFEGCDIEDADFLTRFLETPVPPRDVERAERLYAAVVADGRFPPVKDD